MILLLGHIQLRQNRRTTQPSLSMKEHFMSRRCSFKPLLMLLFVVAGHVYKFRAGTAAAAIMWVRKIDVATKLDRKVVTEDLMQFE